MFDHADQTIEQAVRGAEVRISSNRLDTSRIKAEIAELAKRVRTALAEAKETLAAVGTPERLRGFVERFIGPSVATRDGRLLKQEAPTTTVSSVGANNTVAATGVEPVT